ncbi:MAG: thiosulfate oxidation carrier complex protein SoxZ [Curvibacter sp.]|nr:thiosulfate oxidation carrier complex protein SoxZ [Curvibacter sp.]
MSVRTLIRIPRTARKGEVIEISALIGHPMESGFRPGADGRRLPRNIIERFSCHYDGDLVFAVEFSSAIAANPLIAFHTVASASGTLRLSWEGDEGFRHQESVTISVT